MVEQCSGLENVVISGALTAISSVRVLAQT